MDPRPAAIEARTNGIDRILAVGGSKGGVGKSIVAAGLALALADRQVTSGLFDLDFTSPSDHVVLGARLGLPDEEFGIEPLRVHGFRMMSVASFTEDVPLPLRGAEATSALLELLAITRWGSLDVLILDLPPGLGDVTLDVLRYLPRTELVLVGTDSRLAIESVRRAVRLALELRIRLAGIVENLQRGGGDAIHRLAADHGVPILGAVPFDPGLEEALGNAAALRRTEAYAAIGRIAGRLIG